MIIQNLIIGNDKFGNTLRCGDVCKFKINLERPNCETKVEEMKGMIIYDEDTFAFAFETLDDFAPLLLMECAELNSIEKIFTANTTNFLYFPNGQEWKNIYNNNLGTL